eukprot:gene15923-18187_t
MNSLNSDSTSAAAIAGGLDNTTTAAQLCKACFHPNVNFGHIVMEDCSANRMHKFNERLLGGQEFAPDVVANQLRTMRSSGRATETTEESNSIIMVGRLPTAVDVGLGNALIHGNWLFKVSLGGDVTSAEPNPAAPPAPQSVAPTALPADVFCSPAGVPVVPYPVEGQDPVLLQHALPVWRAMFLRTVWTFVLKDKATNLLANNLEYVYEVANELQRLLRVTPQRQYAFGISCASDFKNYLFRLEGEPHYRHFTRRRHKDLFFGNYRNAAINKCIDVVLRSLRLLQEERKSCTEQRRTELVVVAVHAAYEIRILTPEEYH